MRAEGDGLVVSNAALPAALPTRRLVGGDGRVALRRADGVHVGCQYWIDGP